MKIKICGLSRACDIDFVNEAMPDYIGFVFAKSKRQVTKDKAEELKRLLNRGIITVGVFVNEKIDFIKRLYDDNIIEIIQLHGFESEEYIKAVKDKTGAQIIKAIRVTENGLCKDFDNTAADYLLLDNGAGGTGEAFDWQLIDKRINKPFFLAGGLNINNVNTAINIARPFAVDISSGVESNGFKDKNKILEIVGRIRNE